jgi:short-subunit dehydrogenase
MALPAPRVGAAALVTGASSGVGAEVARELAARGHDVVLLARRAERLRELAGDLTARHGVRAEVVPCDLSDRESRATALRAIAGRGLQVDVLANCAGVGMTGPFHEHECDAAVRMVATNFEAVVDLTGALLPGMIARRSGAVLVVSSLAGAGPVPGFAAYAATKAAVTSFGEALHAEVRAHGVSVTVVCPGPIDTEFGAVADIDALMSRTPAFLTATAEQCAQAGLDGLDAGRRVVIPKPAVRALGVLGAHVPHRLGLPIWRRVFSA